MAQAFDIFDDHYIPPRAYHGLPSLSASTRSDLWCVMSGVTNNMITRTYYSPRHPRPFTRSYCQRAYPAFKHVKNNLPILFAGIDWRKKVRDRFA